MGYDSFMVGIEPPSAETEYTEASSDDLSSEWDTDDSEPTPVTKAILSSQLFQYASYLSSLILWPFSISLCSFYIPTHISTLSDQTNLLTTTTNLSVFYF